ncbi:nucleoside deaminase [Rhodocytophaga aerolata]|uniref:Nucleoside deaminase n=1 Tax=Rhodocytophaga aerolata TaxID=455078 RepID=A0ABT8RID5_9BACT|nr:nucleoside deaminase [Rhodocytophaga aerolata]MDO1451867.1 nucleoside deaminase [Rhodocytophaga aerolata]
MQAGNPPVGALLVKEGKVVGEGIEAGKSKKDITCHAEIEAIRNAITKGQNVDMQDCTLYTTHEPCIMCSYVIRHHKIATIVIGIEVPVIEGVTSSLPILKASDISIWPDPPQIVKGILKKECENLNSAYQNILKKAQEAI